MEIQSKFHTFKTLSLVLGNQAIEKFRQSVILLVGVGGIGCEVLKNISKFPLKKIVIIDLDVIELSNLNRQFYFRKEHISKSKAQVTKQEILKLVPDLNIEAIEGSIYDKKYDNYHFYAQFDLVISALDNMKARQHLAKNCTRYGKVMIDAGTSGFNGQSYPSVRYLTSCHNCYPSNQQESFAVCTIRSRPERSIHCAVYAKNFYQQFFGRELDDFLHKGVLKIKQEIFCKKQSLDCLLIRKFGQQLFNYLFHGQFELQVLQVNTFLWQKVEEKISTPQNVYDQSQIQEKQLTLEKYAEIFMDFFVKLVERKLKSEQKNQIHQTYDKDDRECSLFVFALTNLRILNFRNENQQNNKMKHLTHQECRRFLGKLIPAIASTNSIAASLEVNQVKDYLSRGQIASKYTTISPFNQQKVSFSWLSLPNPLCKVCSPKNMYFQIKCVLKSRSFEQFEQFAKENCFSQNRDLHCGSLLLIKNIKGQKVSANKKKTLNFKSELLIQNTLTLQFLPASYISDMNIQIILINDQEMNSLEEKFSIINLKDIQATIQARQLQEAAHMQKEQHENSDYNVEKGQQNEWQEIVVD